MLNLNAIYKQLFNNGKLLYVCYRFVYNSIEKCTNIKQKFKKTGYKVMLNSHFQSENSPRDIQTGLQQYNIVLHMILINKVSFYS